MPADRARARIIIWARMAIGLEPDRIDERPENGEGGPKERPRAGPDTLLATEPRLDARAPDPLRPDDLLLFAAGLELRLRLPTPAADGPLRLRLPTPAADGPLRLRLPTPAADGPLRLRDAGAERPLALARLLSDGDAGRPSLLEGPAAVRLGRVRGVFFGPSERRRTASTNSSFETSPFLS